MKKYIYADNAATTKLNYDAFEAMKPYMFEDYGNVSQPYSFVRKSKKALREARIIITECINANLEEIYFTSGGTESDNWAINGITSTEYRNQIITSKIEHHAILNSCKAVENLGVPVIYMNVNNESIVQVSELKNIITNKTKLVSIMYANNEIGSIQPIKELCEITHKNGALFHTDAVQAVGHVKIDVQDLGVDMLSASAHKFNGHKGIGFLYIKKGIKILPYINGGSQESSMRAGTVNVAAIVGMAYALKKNCEHLDINSSHIKALENEFLKQLKTVHNLEFIRNGSNNTLPGNISLSFSEKNGEVLLHRLDLKGICVSTGSACDSTNIQISHVLQAIRLNEKFAKGTIRISFGKYNTMEEVIYIAKEICKVIKN